MSSSQEVVVPSGGVRRWRDAARFAVMIAGLVVASIGAPVSAQSSPPVTVTVSEVLDRAMAALDDLTSYRMDTISTSSVMPDAPTRFTVMVVREPELAVRTQYLLGDEAGYDSIVIGDDGWMSMLGTPYRTYAELERPIPEEVQTSTFGTLDRLRSEGVRLTLVGTEPIDGVDALHYLGATVAPTGSPDPYYRAGLQGTLDVWVDAARGHLLMAVVDVTQDDALTFASVAHPIDRHEVTHVFAVDDPSNVITAPEPGTPVQPSPAPGDPGLAATVQRAIEALEAHDSYRLSMAYSSLGSVGSQETMIINSDPPAAEVRITVDGAEFIAYRIIGDRTLVRDRPTQEWHFATPESGPGCPSDPCTIDDAKQVLTGLVEHADGFRLIAEDAEVDGEPAIQLRGDELLPIDEMGSAFLSTDLWISKAGGHLLRMVTDGVGYLVEVRVEGIDDPANVLEAPPSPSPSAS